MLKIKEEVDLKELERFGFWQDKNFKVLNRNVDDDCLEQFRKKQYILILKNRVLVKAKLITILDLQENVITGYEVQTNRVKQYVYDLIQAGLVEKVEG